MRHGAVCGFSALQRAEIAEIWGVVYDADDPDSGFSALQRAEIAEIVLPAAYGDSGIVGFSALQRAEIAEIRRTFAAALRAAKVSVLFNEPKLLKFCAA